MPDVLNQDPETKTQDAPPKGAPKGEALFDNSLAGFRARIAGDQKPKEEEPAKPPEQPGKDPAKPEPEKKEEPKKEDDKEPDPAPPSPPATSPRKRRRQVEERDLENLAVNAAAKASAEVAARFTQPKPDATKPEAAPAEPEIDLPEEIKYRLDIIGEMEAIDPRHKGKKSAYTKWLSELDTYQRKWESEHSGEEYDPSDAEHNSIYKNEPDLPERDYDVAKVRLASRQRVDKELTEQREELSRITAKLAEQEIQPQIVARNRGAMASILSAINPDYAKAIDDAQKVAELEKSDPDGVGIAVHVAKETLPFVTEVVKLWNPASKTTYDEKNPVHQEISQFARKMEEAISQLPDREQIRQGKEFVTMAEWSKMPEAERSISWSMLDQDALLAFKTAEAVHRTKQINTEYEKRLEESAVRRGFKRDVPPESKKEEPASTQAKPSPTPPPAGAARSPVDTSNQAAPTKPADFGDFFLSKLRGK